MTEWVFASAIGVFTACGVWLLLRPRTFDVVLGLALLSYAVNLFIFAMGRLTFGAPAILGTGTPGRAAPLAAHLADPLPQALVLTAIVISFAMTALVLTLALKGRFVNHSDLCDPAVAGDDDHDDGDDGNAGDRADGKHDPDSRHDHDGSAHR